MNRKLVIPLALSLIVVDLISKITATRYLNNEVSILGDLVTLKLHRNPGAAFSIFQNATLVLSIIAIIAFITGLLYLTKIIKNNESNITVPLVILLSGITGNLIDRIFRDPSPLKGEVIDFISIKYFAVFNLSDMMIFIGVLLMFIKSKFRENK